MQISWDLPLSAEGAHGTLDDGTPFLIRPIRASDAEALEAAFATMSARSRYLRFFTIRERLGEEMVRQLTDIDHDRHRAWVVSDPTEPSDVGTDEGRGVAVARLILVEDEPRIAEGALAVVDDHQGRGYGHMLLDLLIGTARATGVEYLRFDTLAENEGMRALLRTIEATRNDELTDGEVLVYDVPIDPDLGGDEYSLGTLYEILRWIAASELAPQESDPAS